MWKVRFSDWRRDRGGGAKAVTDFGPIRLWPALVATTHIERELKKGKVRGKKHVRDIVLGCACWF